MQKLASTPAEERDEAERRVKMRTLGNIRLIAELFNKGIVAERIVTVCITELIGDLKSDPIEDNVEVNLLAMPCFAYGITSQSCQEA